MSSEKMSKEKWKMKTSHSSSTTTPGAITPFLAFTSMNEITVEYTSPGISAPKNIPAKAASAACHIG